MDESLNASCKANSNLWEKHKVRHKWSPISAFSMQYKALFVFVPSGPKPISQNFWSIEKLALLTALSKDDFKPSESALSGCSSYKTL